MRYLQSMTFPTLRQLEYLVAVAETGQFSRAARACGVSQPALSRQVQDVEQSLGLVLFERGSRGARPTADGRLILGRARAVLAEARALSSAAEALRDPLAGRLRLGVIPTLGPTLLPALLPRLAAELPRLALQVLEAQSAELLGALRQGELDVALVALPYPATGVVVRPLFDEPLVLVVPAAHPLALPGPVTPAALVDQPLLLLAQGHCLRDHVLRSCSPRDVDAPSRASSLATLVALVQAGVGATLLPARAVDAALSADPRVVARRFTAPEPVRRIALWWRPGTARQVVLRRVEALLLEA